MKILKYIIILAVIVAVGCFLFKQFDVETPTDIPTEGDTAAVDLGVDVAHTITWNPYEIVSDTVTVNLIRRNHVNVNEYEFVKVIAQDTLNDGTETWTPSREDLGKNLFIQITCHDSATACQSVMVQAPITVVDKGDVTTAAVLNAVK